MLNEKSKSDGQDIDDWQDIDDSPVITSDVIEEFCNAVLDSPELCPYFMELRRTGLLKKCKKMASFVSFVSNKNYITPADTEFLKKIHHGLNINETSYDNFTTLFAHICCRNKSDLCRRKMLSIFSLLKAHVCPVAGSGKIFGAFCEVLSNISPVDWKEDVVEERGTSWVDRFPAPSQNRFFRSSSQICNEEAQYFHYRKRLRKCERLITVIRQRSERMDKRIAKLEEEDKKGRMMQNKQLRDLDLNYK